MNKIDDMNEKLNMTNKINNILEFKKYYIQNPYRFAEEFLGVKLLPYQRIILKVMDKLQAKKPVYSSKELKYYLGALEHLISLEEDSKIAFYENKEYKEITRDEAIQYILKKIKLYKGE